MILGIFISFIGNPLLCSNWLGSICGPYVPKSGGTNLTVESFCWSVGLSHSSSSIIFITMTGASACCGLEVGIFFLTYLSGLELYLNIAMFFLLLQCFSLELRLFA